MSYQGWTNYETWAVSLWLDNEEPLYRETRAMARKVHGRYRQYDLATSLKALVVHCAPGLGATLFADLLTHAIHQANYDEIAKSLLEEVEEAEAAAEDDEDMP